MIILNYILAHVCESSIFVFELNETLIDGGVISYNKTFNDVIIHHRVHMVSSFNLLFQRRDNTNKYLFHTKYYPFFFTVHKTLCDYLIQ